MKLPTTIFNSLIQNIKLDTGTKDIETIGISANFGSYSISFYGKMEDNYKVIVEDFGMTKNNSCWVILEPTQKQLDKMQKSILDKVEHVKEVLKESEEDMEWEYTDLYNENGVKRSEFY